MRHTCGAPSPVELSAVSFHSRFSVFVPVALALNKLGCQLGGICCASSSPWIETRSCFALRTVRACVAFQLRVSVAALLELTELAKPVERPCLCCDTLLLNRAAMPLHAQWLHAVGCIRAERNKHSDGGCAGYFRSGGKEQQWDGLGGISVAHPPAFGPDTLHPRLGMACVGAAPWVVNFNVLVQGASLPDGTLCFVRVAVSLLCRCCVAVVSLLCHCVAGVDVSLLCSVLCTLSLWGSRSFIDQGASLPDCALCSARVVAVTASLWCCARRTTTSRCWLCCSRCRCDCLAVSFCKAPRCLAVRAFSVRAGVATAATAVPQCKLLQRRDLIRKPQVQCPSTRHLPARRE